MSASASDLALAEAAAREGARLVFSSRPWSVSRKPDGSLRSDADTLVEQTIAAWLEAARPKDGILAEEHARRSGSSGRCWVIDPIDGTTSFLRESGQWCVSIALRADGETQLAVLLDPVRDELFRASRGAGAELDGRPITVSSARLEEALLGTGFSPEPAIRELQLEEVQCFGKVVADVRCGGSAALNLAYVACGRLDGCAERGLRPWDFLAGELLVEEAGGRVVAEASEGLRIAAEEVLAGKLVALLDRNEVAHG